MKHFWLKMAAAYNRGFSLNHPELKPPKGWRKLKQGCAVRAGDRQSNDQGGWATLSGKHASRMPVGKFEFIIRRKAKAALRKTKKPPGASTPQAAFKAGNEPDPADRNWPA